MRCLAKRPADRFQTADELVAALEPLAVPSGGITPTQTQPVAALGGEAAGAVCRGGRTPRRRGAVAAAGALYLWKPWARAGARPLDANLCRRAAVPHRRRRPERAVPAAGHGGPDAGQADRRRRAARRRHPLGARRRARCRRRRHAGSDRGRGRRRGPEGRRRPGAAGQHRGTGGSPGHERVARQRARRPHADADQRDRAPGTASSS